MNLGPPAGASCPGPGGGSFSSFESYSWLFTAASRDTCPIASIYKTLSDPQKDASAFRNYLSTERSTLSSRVGGPRIFLGYPNNLFGFFEHNYEEVRAFEEAKVVLESTR